MPKFNISNNDRVRLKHMIDAADEALEFIRGRNRDELNNNRMLVHALVRLLEIIGEAATGLSEEFRGEYPSVQWNQITGMRNRLIHGYFDINLDIVWQTLIEDIPVLKDQLLQIMTDQM